MQYIVVQKNIPFFVIKVSPYTYDSFLSGACSSFVKILIKAYHVQMALEAWYVQYHNWYESLYTWMTMNQFFDKTICYKFL